MTARVRGAGIVALAVLALAAARCAPTAACDAPGAPGAPAPCGGPAVVQAEVGKPFALAAGQEALFSDAGLRVRFDLVANDSRCPTDVVCVWAGNAAMRFLVTDGGTAGMRTLNTQVEPRATLVAGGSLELRVVTLDPLPRSNETVARSAYRVTLEVVRR